MNVFYGMALGTLLVSLVTTAGLIPMSALTTNLGIVAVLITIVLLVIDEMMLRSLEKEGPDPGRG